MTSILKFVKGDVIASFLITIINILGGLAIGVGQKDMEVVGALQRYGLLTIGDGLVSQIPSLVIATAAGVLVTRVASEEADTPLGEELANQIFGAPRALRVAAFFVVGLAVIPGLPSLPFLLIGALLFIASRARARAQSRVARAPAAPARKEADQAAGATRFVPVVVPWALSVSSDLAQLLDDDVRGSQVRRAGIRSAGSALQEVVFDKLGVPLPECLVEVDSDLPDRHVVLHLREVPTSVFAASDDVTDADLAEAVVGHALPVLLARAADFLGIAATQRLLDQLEQIAPATVRQVVPKPVSVALLADVLRRLVEESISVRDLASILEGLAQAAPADKDPLNLTESVRAHLRRQITYALTEGAPRLSALLLTPQIEETIRTAITRTTAGSFLTLAPAAGRDIVAAVRRALETTEGQPVLLTQPDIRRFVRKLVETDLPQLQVVSFADLQPELGIEPVARATLAGA